MSWDTIISITALGGHLGVGTFAAMHLGRTRWAASLTLLSFAATTWTIASFASSIVNPYYLKYVGLIDTGISPFLPMLTLLLTIQFTEGRAHSLEQGLGIAAGALASSSLLGCVSDLSYLFTRSAYWDAAYLLIANATIGTALARLHHYLQQDINLYERQRTYLLIFAVLLGWGLGTTELLADLEMPIPRLGRLGLAIASGTIAFAGFQYRLLPSEYPFSFIAIILASITLIFVFAAFTLSTQHLLFIAMLPASLLGCAALIPLWRNRSEKHLRPKFATESQLSIQRSQIESNIHFVRSNIASHPQFNHLKLEVTSINLANLMTNLLRENTFAVGMDSSLRSTTVIGDSDLLRQAIIDLLEYTIESIPCLDSLHIETGTFETCFLRIENRSVDLSHDHCSTLFEELFSLSSSKAESRLSLVQQVIRSHKGYATLNKERRDQGLSLNLHFPRHFEPFPR